MGAGLAAADPDRQAVRGIDRGEAVLVIDASPPAPVQSAAEHDNVLAPLVAELPLKQAVALAQQITGAARNALYERALQLKQGK